MLGADLLVAPALDRGTDTVEVYFPESGDAWTDLWTGNDVGGAGEWVEVPAPLGKPGVFLRKGAPSTNDIIGGLKAEGIL
jgi:alpha-glucosidase (family GH31 glycosyl hydrolase)